MDKRYSTNLPTSALESLPAEIIQHIASYLARRDLSLGVDVSIIRNNAGFALDSLLNLRATSKTLCAKTEFNFFKSFGSQVVAFDEYHLLRLHQLSQDERFSPMIESLVFVAPKRPAIAEKEQDARYQEELHIALQEPKVQELCGKYARLTTLLAAALMNFRNVKSTSISMSLDRLYSAKVRQRSLTSHPPSIILAASLVAGVPLEEFRMSSLGYGTYHGIKPRVLDNFTPYMGQLTNLKTLRLLLSSVDGQTDMTGLTTFLSQASNLQHLSLAIDKASIEATAPHEPSYNVSYMWALLSHIKLPRLISLGLSGWEMLEPDAIRFLLTHKDTLESLSLDNCAIFGQWKWVLSTLLGSTSLKSLRISQINEFFFRVAFPQTSVPLLHVSASRKLAEETDEDDESWVWVTGGYHPTTQILECEDWDEKLGDILGDLTVTLARVRPKAPDALRWSY